MKSSDLDLLQSFAADGDEAAFAGLVERHAGWVLAAARRRLRDDHLADDAMQAVFLLLSQKAADLVADERTSLSAWLFQVMHFACSRARRSRERRTRHERSAGDLPKAGVTQIDDHVIVSLEDAIAQLPPIDREIVVRRFYQQESFPQVREAMNLSADAARKRLERAIVAVRASMQRDGVEWDSDIELAPSTDRVAMRRTTQIDSLAQGADAMVHQMQAVDYSVMTAEFIVKDVEANLAFFEKLGFQPRWRETPDAMGRLPRASLVSGPARIWLRRGADEGVAPVPGSVTFFFWVNGGSEGLAAHRKLIADQGVAVGPFVDDIGLRNFTVATPDGYAIGFFSQYK